MFSDVLQFVFEIVESAGPGEVFPKGGGDDVIGTLKKLNLEVFYGKYFGMQFGDGLRLVFTGMCACGCVGVYVMGVYMRSEMGGDRNGVKDMILTLL